MKYNIWFLLKNSSDLIVDKIQSHKRKKITLIQDLRVYVFVLLPNGRVLIKRYNFEPKLLIYMTQGYQRRSFVITG